QRFRGHAAVERALAADEMLLDDGDAEPGLAESARADLARRTGPDPDRVERLDCAHRWVRFALMALSSRTSPDRYSTNRSGCRSVGQQRHGQPLAAAEQPPAGAGFGAEVTALPAVTGVKTATGEDPEGEVEVDV